MSVKKKKKQHEGRDAMIILVDKIPTCNSNKGITFIFVLDLDTAALLNTENFEVEGGRNWPACRFHRGLWF